MENLQKSALLLLLTGVLYSCSPAEQREQTPVVGTDIPVNIIKLKRGDFSSPIATSGAFSTKDETILAFKTGGIVSKIYVQEGESIKKGQLLASLDLTEVQSGLTQAKLAFEKARRDYERTGRLFRDSVATQEQYENTKTALDIVEQQYKAAEFNLHYSQIRANQDGAVLRKFVNNGQQVSSGTPILQTNGTAVDSWVLRAGVNDHNWSMITLGDSATIHLTSPKVEDVPGKVVRKSQGADLAGGTYWIEISPEHSTSLTLAAGMFGRATLFPRVKQGGWEIPYESLLDAQGNTGYVFVTQDQHTAHKVAVQLGKISSQTIQVTDGLDDFQYLIVSGSAYLTDQSTIQVQHQ